MIRNKEKHRKLSGLSECRCGGQMFFYGGLWLCVNEIRELFEFEKELEQPDLVVERIEKVLEKYDLKHKIRKELK